MPEEIGLFEAMYSQRAIRRLRPDPVPDELLWRVLEAATKAPSGGNRQPWNFLVVRDPALKARIGAYYRQAWDRTYGAMPPAVRAQQDEATQRNLRGAQYLADHMDQAPVHIFACLRDAPPPGGPAAGSYYGSIFPAVQNLLLAARGLNLGAALTTLHKLYEGEIKELLGVPPEVELVALIPLGYPLGRYGPNRRLPVDKVVYWNRWGERRPGPAQRET